MSHIHTQIHDAVGIITIDRPARFNSLDVRTAQDFRRAALQFARDRDVRVVVLKGLPGVFCSGADLKFIRSGGSADDLEYLTRSESRGPVDHPPERFGDVFKQILEYIHSAISEIRRAPKPFIAAVDGSAAAGGFGIAIACDLVVASTRATFEWAYSKTGLTGAESITFLLPRLVGLRKALDLMLLNPRLSAVEAEALGILTSVHGVERFDEVVLDIAGRLARGPATAFAVAKDLLNQAADMDRLDAHLDRELEELTRIANGPEFAEGLSAFVAKRPPHFTTVDLRP
jgi:2-(1,2-epoxy-1,2-dihydrophenyl)acetyl-CoA isomerase